MPPALSYGMCDRSSRKIQRRPSRTRMCVEGGGGGWRWGVARDCHSRMHATAIPPLTVCGRQPYLEDEYAQTTDSDMGMTTTGSAMLPNAVVVLCCADLFVPPPPSLLPSLPPSPLQTRTLTVR